MNSRVKSRSDHQSLCEKSMMVVANVIRISSFSIAQKTLGVSTTGKGGKDFSGSDYSDMEMEPEKEPLVHDKFPTSRRSQKSRSPPNPTYVLKPAGSNVIYKGEVPEVTPKKEECVDGLASDYINKIRNKLGCAS